MSGTKQLSFSFVRLLVFVSMLILSAAPAGAYTLVLRSGRLVDVPNDFVVAGATLTYEVSKGVQVSLQLVTVDVVATERANREPPGSFLRRVAQPPRGSSSIGQQSDSRAQRNVTNDDLETYRRARVDSENAYERRRLELGLPSLEERREKAAADTEATREQLLKIRAQEQVQEEYWRSRASALRSEIAQTDARIDYVRTRLNELPSTTPLGAFSPVLPFWTFVSGRVSPALGPGFVPGPHIIPVTSVPNVGARVSNGSVGGFRPVGINHNPRPGIRGPGMTSRFPIASGWGVPFQTYDYSYEYSRLISELDELRTHRAGLQSLWRDLEEDARRAGAYPGWLRP